MRLTDLRITEGVGKTELAEIRCPGVRENVAQNLTQCEHNLN